jgi:hypothetical protein
VFQSSYFADMSLDTSMTLTPPQLVEAHLELDHGRPAQEDGGSDTAFECTANCSGEQNGF